MAIFYCATFAESGTNGELRMGAFFDSDIHADIIPADAIEITPKRHEQLLEAQSQGKEIYALTDGIPRFRDPQFRSDERRTMLISAVKREAASRINAISPPWRQINDMRHPSDEGAARFAAIDATRAASAVIEMDIKESSVSALIDFDMSGHPAWPAPTAASDPEDSQ